MVILDKKVCVYTENAALFEFLLASAPHVCIYLNIKACNVSYSHGSKTKVQAALCFIHLAKGRRYANL